MFNHCCSIISFEPLFFVHLFSIMFFSHLFPIISYQYGCFLLNHCLSIISFQSSLSNHIFPIIISVQPFLLKHCFLHHLGGGNSKTFYFHPYLGNDPIWQAYFSDGLVQPPSSHVYIQHLRCIDLPQFARSYHSQSPSAECCLSGVAVFVWGGWYGCQPKNRGKKTQNGWFIRENPIKMDDLGGTIIFRNTHMVKKVWWLMIDLQEEKSTQNVA